MDTNRVRRPTHERSRQLDQGMHQEYEAPDPRVTSSYSVSGLANLVSEPFAALGSENPPSASIPGAEKRRKCVNAMASEFAM
jgi:hypothetical protein